jgi:hypothetical protein
MSCADPAKNALEAANFVANLCVGSNKLLAKFCGFASNLLERLSHDCASGNGGGFESSEATLNGLD